MSSYLQASADTSSPTNTDSSLPTQETASKHNWKAFSSCTPSPIAEIPTSLPNGTMIKSVHR